MPRVAEIKEDGVAAHDAVQARDRPDEHTLQRDGERWKVVAVKDEEMATGIASRLASSLPASQPQPQPTPRRRPGR